MRPASVPPFCTHEARRISVEGGGEIRFPHEKQIHAACRAPAFGDRPHDERLTAADVTGDEDAGHRAHEVGVAPHVAALVELDAELVTRRASGGRRIAVRDLHLLPGERVDTDTVLEAGELIEALELPGPAPRSAYVKVRERESYEYALVSAAVALELDGELIRNARIALGSVALRPWRLEAAEQALAGVAPGSLEAAEALDHAMADARPLAGNGFKVKLARNAALRALGAAAGPTP